MLGEKIGEESGKIIGQRVLPSEGGLPRMEITVQSSGKIIGVDYNATVTYRSGARPGGGLWGEGEGVLMTKDGDSAILTGSGVGKMGAGGAGSWRGALYYQTTSAKLAKLNSLCAVFENEVDATGNATGKYWEWK